MSEDQRIIVIEDDPKANHGLGKIFGIVFVAVMGIAIIDRAFTLAWSTVGAWFN
ncbi:hypothetical protein LP421_32760 (plasmid) [Rhizobium sp. RCAM05350]|uniref:hypothetical protein n=1 Tax=Rhizobium sp. RCAM05350 TaxID=2895568 RepID=UPI002076901A|nr:hypothetical protein [Rhizobium sp. RCAM05350]URK89461.1 hypothetical protein LP421_32760 [Rhizobium sp. RCAM05350]